MWDRWDYIKETEKQLRDSTVYKEIDYNKKILSQLVDSSNKYFKKLNSSGYISYKEMKYFKKLSSSGYISYKEMKYLWVQKSM